MYEIGSTNYISKDLFILLHLHRIDTVVSWKQCQLSVNERNYEKESNRVCSAVWGRGVTRLLSFLTVMSIYQTDDP
jgi:hypothetical protein